MGLWLTLGVATGPALSWALRGWIPVVVRPSSVLVVCAVSTVFSVLVGLTFAGPVGAWWWLTMCGLGLAAIDLSCHRLPHVWVAALALGGLVMFTAESVTTGDGHAVLRALLAGLLVLLPATVLSLFCSPNMGFGDFTLLAALAVYAGWFSWTAVVFVLCAALFGLGIVAGIAWTLRVRGRRERIAAGPGLLLGAWLALAWLA